MLLEDLSRQIIQNVALAAGESFDEVMEVMFVTTPLYRQHSELQPGYPALGAVF